jgi:hypothetical protein
MTIGGREREIEVKSLNEPLKTTVEEWNLWKLKLNSSTNTLKIN